MSVIDRARAIALLEDKVRNENLRRHMLATEAILRALARRLGEDEEVWGLTGLLHDIDLEAVEQDPARHAATAAAWLEGELPAEALAAIRAHNGEALGLERQSRLDHALAAAENLTGLVVAAALVLPSKKIAELKSKSVRKRFREPRFAAGANREIIAECERLGLELAEFVDLGVEAMRGLGPELGL